MSLYFNKNSLSLSLSQTPFRTTSRCLRHITHTGGSQSFFGLHSTWTSGRFCEIKEGVYFSVRAFDLGKYEGTLCYAGNAVAQMVEALCYKPTGRGFDSRRDPRGISLT